MKKLYLIRGIPGAGKTEFAHSICDTVVSADDYFTDRDGNYSYVPAEIGDAHAQCQDRVRNMMRNSRDIAVANTFTRGWEMDPYHEFAEQRGYRVYSIVVENRHGNDSIHNVPEKTITNMRNRFEVKL